MAKYQDLNTSFYTSNAEDRSVAFDMTNIKKNLQRLFSTRKGDIPFNREYGTSLWSLLFENNVEASDIIMFLYMDITEFEPRISLNPADIIVKKINNNTYEVTCDFIVPSLNNNSGSATSSITKE